MHEKEAIDSLILTFQTQANEFMVDRDKALKEQFRGGMRHERCMCNLAHHTLESVIIPHSMKE